MVKVFPDPVCPYANTVALYLASTGHSYQISTSPGLCCTYKVPRFWNLALNENLSISHVIILFNEMHSPQSWPALHNVSSIEANDNRKSIMSARVFIISPCTNDGSKLYITGQIMAQPPMRERERIRPDVPARRRFSLMSNSLKKWKIVARCLRKTLYEANSRSPFIMKQLCSDQLPLISIAIHFS